jgi:hypothetical protein
MHLLGEYFDEREWMLDFHTPHFIIRKEEVMNAAGYPATKKMRETMSSMYLSCTKYDRMYQECINVYGAALITDPWNMKYAHCNNIADSFDMCKRNHQWFYFMKKYHPESFNIWRGKGWKGEGNSRYITPNDI